MKKELIIWDFDGVIADTESLWLYNRMTTINETFHLNWTFEKTVNTLLGISDKTKREVLDNLGIRTDDEFWLKNKKLDYDMMFQKGFELTQGVEDILKLNIKQCIATGGLKEKTAIKIKIVGLEKYFTEDKVFTADMVEKGKPEPDLFLLACQKMDTDPQNAIVIEDSIAGLKAAIKANITPICFTKYIKPSNQKYFKELKNHGIENIFNDMKDIKNFIKKNMN